MDEQHTLDLEHESGLRPLGQDPDHCSRCRTSHDIAKRQAACPHDFTEDIRTFGGDVFAHCADCGIAL